MELQHLCMGCTAETGGAAVLPTLTACLDQIDHTGQCMVSNGPNLRLLPGPTR